VDTTRFLEYLQGDDSTKSLSETLDALIVSRRKAAERRAAAARRAALARETIAGREHTSHQMCAAR
jgi:hypothetical protein